jgi:Flp pilus assembly pilin Flp
MQTLLTKLTERYVSLKHDSEAGQGMVEYALILFLVSIAGIAILELIGVQVTDVFSQVNDALGGTNPT